MKAMVLDNFGRPLQLKDVPEPSLRRGEVLVKVFACGLCGSDVKITNGKIKTVPLPHIPGHEIAGTVVKVAPDVQGIETGQHVIAHIYVACNNCSYCENGENNICRDLKGRIGFEFPGGLGEYVTIPAANNISLAGRSLLDRGRFASVRDYHCLPWFD